MPPPSLTGVPNPGFWRGRRVLVTGHTGFKGAWLVLWLRRLGADVTGFGRSAPTAPSLFELAGCAQDVTSVEGDVRSLEAVEAAVRDARPEVVIHMAAEAIVRRSLRDPLTTYAVNVMGTANVLDAIRRKGAAARAVVCVTTDKCYLNREWEWAYREDEPLGGKDPYSSSKACQELVAVAYRDSYLAERGVGLATARAGNVIGGGDWAPDRLVPDLMRAAIAGEPLAVRSPGAVRPWQHVLSPLSGYLVLAERLWEDPAAHAAAWNFGPLEGDARPVSWVVDRLRDRWPGPIEVEIAGAGTADGEGKEAMALKLDSSRARARLGWAPGWDLARGLDATVEWYAGYRDGADLRALCGRQLESFGAR
ncbi:MAG: CDP-glucose 4,6-dehydratase [Actinomycetota bacterium]|nr:CDP-glucose 4,6-dehydratase [Actinomycetota bacterium]